jgi:hypothetical protein
MKVERRDLLLSGPAALFGFHIAEALRAQGQSAAPVDFKVVDFWVRGMGVPSNTVVGAERTRGRQSNGPAVSDYGREPLFLHHDPKDNVLLTPDQITLDRLAPSGPTSVTFQLSRMRLNDADNTKFRQYASGGIYLDLGQATPAASTGSMLQDIETIAGNVFAAIFPQGGKSGGSGAGGKNGGGGSGAGGSGSGDNSSGKKGKGNQFLPSPQSSSYGAGGSAVPLQQAKQAMSITLPNGAGRTSFAVFAKDRKKTLFGKFIDVFGELAASPMLSYLPMLSLPAVGASTLSAVRSLVANLQAHGQNQQWIMMSTPMDLATTQSAAQSAPDALKLAPGNYVLIPKEQSDAIKNQLDKLKVSDGFLVPKETKALEVYDAYASAAPGVSYITVSVSVQAQATKGKAG